MGRRCGPDWSRLVIRRTTPGTKVTENVTILNSWTELVSAVKKAFSALGEQHPKVLAAYSALEEASAKGALDARTRGLISIAVAITTRYDGCTDVHTEATLEAGASEAEITQTLAAVVSLNADAAYVYSLRALEAYDQSKE